MAKPYRDSRGRWVVDIRRARTGERTFRCTRTFTTKTQAEAFLLRLQKQVEEAAANGMQMPDSTTLSKAFDEWWFEHKDTFSRTNRTAMLNRVKAWQKSRFGDLPVRDLTRQHIRGWILDRQAQGRAGNTIRNDLHPLESLYKWLEIDLDVSIDNPVGRLKSKLDTSEERDRRLTNKEHEQISAAFKALADAQRQRDRAGKGWLMDVRMPNGKLLRVGQTQTLYYLEAAFEAAIECALRKGKLLALIWREVDLERRVITIKEKSAKNKNTPTTVPLSPRLTTVLKDLHGPAKKIGKALDEKVFGSLTGDRAYRYLLDVCKALEIPDLHWHDLRHEACSRLAELGWSTLEIQRVSGHKSLQSLKRYVHISDQTILKKWDEHEHDQRKTGT